MDIEEPDQLDTSLRKQGWFLGELSEDAARTILQSSGKYNVFIVHKTDSGGYVLSVRFPVEDIDDGVVEHLHIREMEENKVQLEGQSSLHDSIIEAINSYTTSKEPPLTSAFKKQDLETQLSITSISAPPAYDQANKQLQPDIAPLPKIDQVKPEKPTEAKAGKISPTGSLEYNRYASYDSYYYSGRDRNPEPPHMYNPHWWRYRDKPCCHPKNTCHCCWYRETYWDGYREVNEHSWYNCKETGCCMCLLLTCMWCLIWPFVLVGICCYGCCALCYLCCFGYDDD